MCRVKGGEHWDVDTATVTVIVFVTVSATNSACGGCWATEVAEGRQLAVEKGPDPVILVIYLPWSVLTVTTRPPLLSPGRLGDCRREPLSRPHFRLYPCVASMEGSP